MAIELAAARLRAMSLEQLRERLADRYNVLTLGSRGAPKRQQTLSCCVGWSYEFDAAHQQGGAMSFDEAVAYALSDDPEKT